MIDTLDSDSIDLNNTTDSDTTYQISLRNVSKIFHGNNSLLDKLTGKTKADFTAIENIDLDIKHNTFVSIIGPSGCGKSTMLDIIAGLSTATSGTVSIDGRIVNQPGPDRGMVFQNYALMPWMTVKGQYQICRRNCLS